MAFASAAVLSAAAVAAVASAPVTAVSAAVRSSSVAVSGSASRAAFASVTAWSAAVFAAAGLVCGGLGGLGCQGERRRVGERLLQHSVGGGLRGEGLVVGLLCLGCGLFELFQCRLGLRLCRRCGVRERGGDGEQYGGCGHGDGHGSGENAANLHMSPWVRIRKGKK